jgi:uncharacterized lipoprotein YddW (UPF0748 family)
MSEALTTRLDEVILWAAVGGLEASYLGAGPPLAQPAAADRRAAAALTEPDTASIVRTPGLPQEVRALWVTRWDYQTVDDVRIICDKAAAANFNLLYFQVRGNADAFYRSRVEPWAARLSGTLGQDPGWDPLQVAIDEAHARGLELHAWVNVYPAWLGETPPTPSTPETMFDRFNRLYGDAWLMWDRNQQPMRLNQQYLWANPAHWAVIEHITHVCKDIVGRYYVDGLHLDNVRYAGWEYSSDALTTDRLNQAAALELDLSRKEYQRRQVDQLITGLRQTMDRLKPGLPLSAAVWPVYYDTWEWWNAGDGFSGFCQDSVGWLRAGIMDTICPMLYLSSITTDHSQFSVLVRDFVARSTLNSVVAGITTTYDSFGPIGLRIDLARAAGAAGQSLFAYGHINSHNYWDDFLAGPYSTRAVVLPPPSARNRVTS